MPSARLVFLNEQVEELFLARDRCLAQRDAIAVHAQVYAMRSRPLQPIAYDVYYSLDLVWPGFYK